MQKTTRRSPRCALLFGSAHFLRHAAYLPLPGPALAAGFGVGSFQFAPDWFAMIGEECSSTWISAMDARFSCSTKGAHYSE